MILILFRHGEAEEVEAGRSEALRGLTPEGVTANARSIRAIERAGLRPDLIAHSPLARAAQTAEAAAEILKPPGGVRADPRLAGGAGVDEVRGIAADYPGDALMLVGHNPDLSLIAGLLIGGGQLALKTSGVACVSLPVVEPGAGRLEWLIQPALCASG